MSTLVRFHKLLDLSLAVLVPTLLFGTCLAFGGAAWWAPLLISGLVALIVIAWILRAATSGKWRMHKSPLAFLGLSAIGLAVFQLAPVPASIATLVSPQAREVHTRGVLGSAVKADDPEATLPDPMPIRTPLTLDRVATLRWIAGALGCLAVFWVVSHYTDRLDRLYLVWGSIVTAFLLNGAILVVQLIGQVDGMYGFIDPGQGPKWSPSLADAAAAPGETALRQIPGAKGQGKFWAVTRPDRTRQFGTMLGGADAFLALAALGLPLTVTVALQIMAPRGSREGLWNRLDQSGHSSLLVLIYILSILSVFLVGIFAGPLLGIGFGATIALIGLPILFVTGLRWKGFRCVALCVGALTGGVFLGESWNDLLPQTKTLPRVDFARARAVWSDSVAIVKDFPIIGTGLGSFSSIQPYYKTRDAASTTAMSSLLQWLTESGVVGVALLGLGTLWALTRLPSAFGRVGSADRALAFGLIGTILCFAFVSTVHWTVELVAVALAASAVAGTTNRWLCGGTDLFVERG